MMRDKPFSRACENNREPILQALLQWFARTRNVLEIGSGTGQHAVFFARHLPHLVWQCADLAQNHAGINAWIDDEGGDNLRRPIALDVAGEWPALEVDGVFSANTAHIMAWDEVVAMFAGVGKLLAQGGVFVLYGPFNRNGEFTSESNRQFDLSLRRQNPRMGVRDDRDLIALGERHALEIVGDAEMPANNRLLVWRAG